MSDRVLLVVDDPASLGSLVRIMESNGAIALRVADASRCCSVIEEEEPDLAIIELAGHTVPPHELIEAIRMRSDLPIIVLSVDASEDAKVRGLDAGADDHVVRPFGERELVARVRAHLRRARGLAVSGDRVMLRAGPLTLNVAQHAAKKQGRSLNLTPTEFRLLHYLMDRTSVVVPTAALLKAMWGYEDSSAREALRVTLYRLRHKLEDDPSEPQLLHTVPGVGVMLKPQADHQAEPAAS